MSTVSNVKCLQYRSAFNDNVKLHSLSRSLKMYGYFENLKQFCNFTEIFIVNKPV